MSTILVIDDHDATRQFIQHICMAHGFHCVSIPMADDCLTVARQLQPAVIFVDLILPGNVNGWEAIRLLKDDPNLKDTRVIAITAGEHLKTALLAGSDGYLRKPFTVQQILHYIQSP